MQRWFTQYIIKRCMNKTLAILGYILFLIPLLAGDWKNDPFLKFHTNQAIVLFIAFVAVVFFTSMLSAILPFALFALIGLIGTFLYLAEFALMIIGIINAANNTMKPLPIIGGIQILR